RLWPWLILGTAVADLLFNSFEDPWPLRLMLLAHAGNVASALAGAVLVRWKMSRRPRLDTIGQFLALVLCGGVLALPITATLGASLICWWEATEPVLLTPASWFNQAL